MGIQERKEREKERRRQQIMVAAKRVFSDKGFNKATMEDIAQEAELSPGTLYLYFKNKEELYASLSLRILQYLLIRVEHVNDDKETDPEEKLKALMDAMYDVYEFDPLIIINMFHLQSSETLRNLSPQLMEEIKNLSRKSLGSIAKIFENGVEQGLFFRIWQPRDRGDRAGGVIGEGLKQGEQLAGEAGDRLARESGGVEVEFERQRFAAVGAKEQG